jgi:hypothetical protein
MTHIHNGDPLNDSTGAIGMLIRLIAVGVLLTIRQRSAATCLQSAARYFVPRGNDRLPPNRSWRQCRCTAPQFT